MLNPYKYEDYRSFINAYVNHIKERGTKSKLAEAAGCQLSYLSQSLKGSVQLTEDHLFGISKFVGLDSKGTEYVSLMGRAERASSRQLRKHILSRMAEMQSEDKVLSNSLGLNKMRSKFQQKYYSTWYYSAVHIALSIPAFRNQPALIKALDLTPDALMSVIEFLIEIGAIERYENYYRTKEHNIHIPGDSHLHISYNLAWRSFMNQRLQVQNPSDLHYTAIHSLSESDVSELRALIIDFIDKSRKIVAPSDEENLAALTIDFCSFEP